MTSYTQLYLEETHIVLDQIDPGVVERLARELAGVRNRGGASSSWGSAVRRVTPAMPSMTSARSVASRPTRQVTMFQS